MPKTRGDHVGKLQRVLITLDSAAIADGELSSATYGETTAAAVLNYKDSKDGKRPKIINKAYQAKADNITGIMTMASMDREMFARQLADPDADFIKESYRQSTFRGAPLGFFRRLWMRSATMIRRCASPGGISTRASCRAAMIAR